MNEQKRQELGEYYFSGASLAEVAERYGLTYDQACKHLRTYREMWWGEEISANESLSTYDSIEMEVLEDQPKNAARLLRQCLRQRMEVVEGMFQRREDPSQITDQFRWGVEYYKKLRQERPTN